MFFTYIFWIFIYFFCLVVKSVFSWGYARYNYIIFACFDWIFEFYNFFGYFVWIFVAPQVIGTKMNNYLYRLFFLRGFYMIIHTLSFCAWEMLYHNIFLTLYWFRDSVTIEVFTIESPRMTVVGALVLGFRNDWF